MTAGDRQAGGSQPRGDPGCRSPGRMGGRWPERCDAGGFGAVAAADNRGGPTGCHLALPSGPANPVDVTAARPAGARVPADPGLWRLPGRDASRRRQVRRGLDGLRREPMDRRGEIFEDLAVHHLPVPNAQLTDVINWSPDGTKIVVGATDGSAYAVGELYLIDVATGRTRQITDIPLDHAWWWSLQTTFSRDHRGLGPVLGDPGEVDVRDEVVRIGAGRRPP